MNTDMCEWKIKISYGFLQLVDEVLYSSLSYGRNLCKVLEGRGCMLQVLAPKVVQTGFNNLSSFIYQRKYVKRKGKCAVGTKC